jgi:hypothetical protein
VWCGVVWCGVVWCGVVWCGVVWCGVVWCGVCGVVCCGVVWCVCDACVMRVWCAVRTSCAKGCDSQRTSRAIYLFHSPLSTPQSQCILSHCTYMTSLKVFTHSYPTSQLSFFPHFSTFLPRFILL